MSDLSVVLTFAGHDPSSGAGLAADAATLWALGCYPVGVVTALTAQNTHGVERFSVLDPQWITEQARALVRDFPIRAVKTGMLGTPGVVTAVAAVVEELGSVPVVVDPVLAAGDGASLAAPDLAAALNDELIPQASVVTPNFDEARALSGADDPDAMAARIRVRADGGVLITGTDVAREGDIVHRWYRRGAAPQLSHWPRVPGRFHGSGCTLAAAVAAYLSRGVSLDDAVERGLDFTWRSIDRALAPGSGQRVPNRFFAVNPTP